MSNFVNEKLYEIQLRIMKLFLNISENSRIDNSIRSMQGYFMFFISDDRIDFISFCVDLLQIILKLFDFSLQTLNILEIRLSNCACFSFTLIVHSQFDRFYNSF